MSAYNDIVAKIEGIKNGNKNTALQVRTVLRDILEFTKNPVTPSPSGTEYFHFMTESKPVSDKLKNFLHYSIKGVKGQWINLTFNLFINNLQSNSPTTNVPPNVNIYPFQMLENDHVLSYLKEIVVLNRPTVRFFIPYTCTINGVTLDYALSTSIYFSEKGEIIFDFNHVSDPKSVNEQGITTIGTSFSSVSFHCPENFDNIGS